MSLPRVMSLDPGRNPAHHHRRSGERPSSRPAEARSLQQRYRRHLTVSQRRASLRRHPGKSFTLRLATSSGDLADRGIHRRTPRICRRRQGDRAATGRRADYPRFIDGSVIEMILGQRIGLTKRFYYTGNSPDVSAIVESEAESVKLAAWKIAPISPNRMTT